MTVKLSGLARAVYPRFPSLAYSTRLNAINFINMRRIGTPPRMKSHDERVREMLIHELGRNPNILGTSTAAINRGGTSWLRRLVLIASSTVVGMGIYLSYEIFHYKLSHEESLETKHMFYPLWLGVNWPRQRQWPFPEHIKYFDEKRYATIQADPEFQKTLQSKHIEHQVLNCLFRSHVVRESFKLPISVWTTPSDTLELWIEPRYSTLHGPLFTFSKKEGKVSLEAKWHIKSIAWQTDIESFISDVTSQVESLTTAEASRNTHGKGSGHVHEATKDDPNTRFDSLLVKDQSYVIAFRGTLQVSDLAKQRKGIVSFTGLIDNDHPGLNAGVRIITLNLEVDEPDKPNLVYKLR